MLNLLLYYLVCLGLKFYDASFQLVSLVRRTCMREEVGGWVWVGWLEWLMYNTDSHVHTNTRTHTHTHTHTNAFAQEHTLKGFITKCNIVCMNCTLMMARIINKYILFRLGYI